MREAHIGPLFVLAAVLAATMGCSALQGRDDCFGQTMTDRCAGAASWAMAPAGSPND